MDYQSIPIVMNGLGLPQEKFKLLFNDLRFMEGVVHKLKSTK